MFVRRRKREVRSQARTNLKRKTVMQRMVLTRETISRMRVKTQGY
jgi:hypothetical protein